MTVIVLDAGAALSLLATTSIVFSPLCRATEPVKTPLPTCAGWPRICTAASGGSTVPLTVTRSARCELPSVGAVICTLTLSLLGEVVVAVLSSEPPQAAAASTRRTMVATRLRLERRDALTA